MTQELLPADPAVIDAWSSGWRHETAFWQEIISGSPNQPAEWCAEMLDRCSADRAFDPEVSALVTTAPLDAAVILDLCAGPVSILGWHHGGARLDIRPYDALADRYDALLAEAGLVPPVRTRRGEAERVAEFLPPGSADLVHIRNGLDHCYDPVAVVAGCAAVLKPGGALFLRTYQNEAESARYHGLHQWNIANRDGRLVIWRPGIEVDVGQRFPEFDITLGWTNMLTAVLRKQR